MLLGCGKTEAFIQTRGGGQILAKLPWTGQLSYGRRLDDMTSASVVVPVEGMDPSDPCCLMLEALNAWEHELLITRDSEDVWVGVVFEPQWTQTRAVIDARDLFQWFERRILIYDRAFVAANLGDIFLTYAMDALSQDTSPNITVAVGPTQASGDREIFADQRRRAADEMRELSRSGVDFTMIGRTLRGGGEEIPTTPLATLTNATLKDRTLTQRGSMAASRASVIGSRLGAAEQVIGVAGDIDERIGLVELTWNEDGILDTASAEAAAASRVAMLKRAPYFLTGRLDAETPIGFDELIPGARVDVDVQVGCRHLEGAFRLSDVHVSASVSDKGAGEDVAVTLIPLGAEAVS